MSNMPPDTRVLELLRAYALGSLNADELQCVEEHLKAIREEQTLQNQPLSGHDARI